MSETHELRLHIDATAAKRGSEEFKAAITAVKQAVAELKRDTSGAFETLDKKLKSAKSAKTKIDIVDKGAINKVASYSSLVKDLSRDLKSVKTAANGTKTAISALATSYADATAKQSAFTQTIRNSNAALLRHRDLARHARTEIEGLAAASAKLKDVKIRVRTETVAGGRTSAPAGGGGSGGGRGGSGGSGGVGGDPEKQFISVERLNNALATATSTAFGLGRALNKAGAPASLDIATRALDDLHRRFASGEVEVKDFASAMTNFFTQMKYGRAVVQNFGAALDNQKRAEKEVAVATKQAADAARAATSEKKRQTQASLEAAAAADRHARLQLLAAGQMAKAETSASRLIQRLHGLGDTGGARAMQAALTALQSSLAGGVANTTQMRAALTSFGQSAEMAKRQVAGLQAAQTAAAGAATSLARAEHNAALGANAIERQMRSLAGATSASSQAWRQATGNLRGMENAMNTTYQLTTLFRTALGSFTLGAFVSSIYEAGAALEQFNVTMEVATGSKLGALQNLDFITGLSDNLGTSLATAREDYAKFAVASELAGVSMEDTQRIFESVASALAVMGRGAQDQQLAFLALEQMMSKGTISSEELRRQLGERLPGAVNLMAKAVGATTAELQDMLKAGSLASAEVLPKFADEIDAAFGSGVVAAQRRASTNLGKMRNEITKFLQSVADSGFMDQLAASFKNLTETMKSDDVADAARAIGETFAKYIQIGGDAINWMVQNIEGLASVGKAVLGGLLVRQVVLLGKALLVAGQGVAAFVADIAIRRAATDLQAQATVRATTATTAETRALIENGMAQGQNAAQIQRRALAQNLATAGTLRSVQGAQNAARAAGGLNTLARGASVLAPAIGGVAGALFLLPPLIDAVSTKFGFLSRESKREMAEFEAAVRRAGVAFDEFDTSVAESSASTVLSQLARDAATLESAMPTINVDTEQAQEDINNLLKLLNDPDLKAGVFAQFAGMPFLPSWDNEAIMEIYRSTERMGLDQQFVIDIGARLNVDLGHLNKQFERVQSRELEASDFDALIDDARFSAPGADPVLNLFDAMNRSYLERERGLQAGAKEFALSVGTAEQQSFVSLTEIGKQYLIARGRNEDGANELKEFSALASQIESDNPAAAADVERIQNALSRQGTTIEQFVAVAQSSYDAAYNELKAAQLAAEAAVDALVNANQNISDDVFNRAQSRLPQGLNARDLHFANRSAVQDPLKDFTTGAHLDLLPAQVEQVAQSVETTFADIETNTLAMLDTLSQEVGKMPGFFESLDPIGDLVAKIESSTDGNIADVFSPLMARLESDFAAGIEITGDHINGIIAEYEGKIQGFGDTTSKMIDEILKRFNATDAKYHTLEELDSIMQTVARESGATVVELAALEKILGGLQSDGAVRTISGLYAALQAAGVELKESGPAWDTYVRSAVETASNLMRLRREVTETSDTIESIKKETLEAAASMLSLAEAAEIAKEAHARLNSTDGLFKDETRDLKFEISLLGMNHLDRALAEFTHDLQEDVDALIAEARDDANKLMADPTGVPADQAEREYQERVAEIRRQQAELLRLERERLTTPENEDRGGLNGEFGTPDEERAREDALKDAEKAAEDLRDALLGVQDAAQDVYKTWADDLVKLNEAHRDFARDLDQQNLALDLLIGGQARTIQHAEMLAEAMATGDAATVAQTQAMLEQAAAAELLNRRLQILASDPVKEWVDSVPTWLEAGQQIEVGVFNSLSDSLAEMMKTGKFSWESLGQSILSTVADVVSDMAVREMLSMFGMDGADGGQVGFGLGQRLQDRFDYSRGSVFDPRRDNPTATNPLSEWQNEQIEKYTTQVNTDLATDSQRAATEAWTDAMRDFTREWGQLPPGVNGQQPSVAGGLTGTTNIQGVSREAINAIQATPAGLPDFAAFERQYGLPAGYLARTAQIESGFNPRAQNPNSSAGGLFQFIDSTAADYGLTNRFDPHQATDAAARLARDNMEGLRSVLGRDATGAELYLAHQQGLGGARGLLRGTGSASSVVGGDAVNHNGGRGGQSAGSFAQSVMDYYGQTPADGSVVPQQAGPTAAYAGPTVPGGSGLPGGMGGCCCNGMGAGGAGAGTPAAVATDVTAAMQAGGQSAATQVTAAMQTGGQTAASTIQSQMTSAGSAAGQAVEQSLTSGAQTASTEIGLGLQTGASSVGQELGFGGKVAGQEITTALLAGGSSAGQAVEQSLTFGAKAASTEIGLGLRTGASGVGQELGFGGEVAGKQITTAMLAGGSSAARELSFGGEVLGKQITAAMMTSGTAAGSSVKQALTFGAQTASTEIGLGLQTGASSVGQELGFGGKVAGQEITTALLAGGTTAGRAVEQSLTFGAKAASGEIGRGLQSGASAAGQQVGFGGEVAGKQITTAMLAGGSSAARELGFGGEVAGKQITAAMMTSGSAAGQAVGQSLTFGAKAASGEIGLGLQTGAANVGQELGFGGKVAGQEITTALLAGGTSAGQAVEQYLTFGAKAASGEIGLGLQTGASAAGQELGFGGKVAGQEITTALLAGGTSAGQAVEQYLTFGAKAASGEIGLGLQTGAANVGQQLGFGGKVAGQEITTALLAGGTSAGQAVEQYLTFGAKAASGEIGLGLQSGAANVGQELGFGGGVAGQKITTAMLAAGSAAGQSVQQSLTFGAKTASTEIGTGLQMGASAAGQQLGFGGQVAGQQITTAMLAGGASAGQAVQQSLTFGAQIAKTEIGLGLQTGASSVGQQLSFGGGVAGQQITTAMLAGGMAAGTQVTSGLVAGGAQVNGQITAGGTTAGTIIKAAMVSGGTAAAAQMGAVKTGLPELPATKGGGGFLDGIMEGMSSGWGQIAMMAGTTLLSSYTAERQKKRQEEEEHKRRMESDPNIFAASYAIGTANTSGIPAILHDNEAVIPLSGNRKVPVELNDDGQSGKRGQTVINQTFNITTSDADSFRRSQKQVAADMATMGSRAVSQNR